MKGERGSRRTRSQCPQPSQLILHETFVETCFVEKSLLRFVKEASGPNARCPHALVVPKKATNEPKVKLLPNYARTLNDNNVSPTTTDNLLKLTAELFRHLPLAQSARLADSKQKALCNPPVSLDFNDRNPLPSQRSPKFTLTIKILRLVVLCLSLSLLSTPLPAALIACFTPPYRYRRRRPGASLARDRKHRWKSGATTAPAITPPPKTGRAGPVGVVEVAGEAERSFPRRSLASSSRRVGHLGILQRAWPNSCSWDEATCSGAACKEKPCWHSPVGQARRFPWN